jgi:hypothetical protein
LTRGRREELTNSIWQEVEKLRPVCSGAVEASLEGDDDLGAYSG